MSSQDDQKLIQIFWPLEKGQRVPTGKEGEHFLIYGWRCSDTHYVVGAMAFLSSANGANGARERCDAALRREETEGCSLLAMFAPGSTPSLQPLLPAARRIDNVLYMRPNPRQLRFLTLRRLQLDVSTEGAASATIEDAYSSRYRDLEGTDFTRPTFKPSNELEAVISKVREI
ncbi:hypothetical protein CALVIDRAFT_153444 [Calocera viscosa TUFC12733]|uniref:Uncharacterized protein n=1 Tax=Calocera viscosa (strain TUFC12733) TaxID=1330018 RepID=A0A167LLK2_CALVF|nr:hypothetical protein CALVIDRAFT_153444 [Calocera viscosa TUFC12733]